MKINDIYREMSMVRNAGSEGAQRPEAGQDNATPALGTGAGSEAMVDLSIRSVELSKVMESMDRPDVDRAEKVKEIRGKILSGTYDVDPSRVAEKMLRETLLDLTKD